MKQFINQKAEFNKIYEKYKQLGKSAVRLTQSALVSTVPISNGRSSYNFPILETDPGFFEPLDKRLNINDEFIITSMGLYIFAEVTDPEQPTLRNNWIWLTTPPMELDISFFQQNPLYNGTISISVNNIKYMEKWDTKRHEYRGVTQFQGVSVGTPNATLPSNDFANNAMYPVSPMVTLSGAKKNDISLTIPQPIDAAAGFLPVPVGAQLTVNAIRIGMKFDGFLAQNASKFQD